MEGEHMQSSTKSGNGTNSQPSKPEVWVEFVKTKSGREMLAVRGRIPQPTAASPSPKGK